MPHPSLAHAHAHTFSRVLYTHMTLVNTQTTMKMATIMAKKMRLCKNKRPPEDELSVSVLVLSDCWMRRREGAVRKYPAGSYWAAPSGPVALANMTSV